MLIQKWYKYDVLSFLAGMMKLVTMRDSKSRAARLEGSSPSPGTNTELRGSERANAWACRRHAHCVSPEFRPESKGESTKNESELGAQARRVFSPRSRFEIKSNFDIVFALIQKEFLRWKYFWYTNYADNYY